MGRGSGDLDHPVKDRRDELVASVAAIVHDRLLPGLDPAPRALLLVGSYAEGWANHTSDIDIVAVVPQPEDRRLRMTHTAHEIGDRIVDVVSITETALRGRLDRLDTIYRTGAYIGEGLVTRLAAAVVLHDADGVGQSIVDAARSYTPSPSTFDELLRTALSFYHDAMGAMGSGDPATATLMARMAATVTIDLALLADGERSLKPKWHLRRLRREGREDLIDRYERAVQVDAADRHTGLRALADLDQLLCHVLEIDSLHDLGSSPFIERITTNAG